MPRPDLLHHRFVTQHVTGPGLEQPEDVVRLLGAVQSQDYLGAKWSVGQRVRNGTDVAVEEAFNAGRILRTHVLRPTWHLVLPEDIRWMLHLTAPHVLRRNSYQNRGLELDDALFARADKLFTMALEGGRQLTRQELRAVLRSAGIVTGTQRLAHIVAHAELTGLICSGAVRGKQQTYALLEERVPPVPALTRDEALAALTRRFFTGHAPATLKHFVWWSELSVAEAKKGLAMVQQELTSEVVDGQTFWYGATRPSFRRRKAAAYLIPEYDESLVGSRDFAVPDLPRARGKKLWKDNFFRPIIIDGKRAGTWRRDVSRGTVVITTNLFATLDATQSRLLQTAAERYGMFLGVPAEVD
ncbi:MAG: winged helix DNA-binding domain-containing protein [Gemmatimonadaceae bacterium]